MWCRESGCVGGGGGIGSEVHRREVYGGGCV